VMDGQFVAGSCLDAELAKQVSFSTLLMLDVHLMVANPMEAIKQYLGVRPNYITVHYESFNNKEDIIKAIELIKQHGVLVGVSINPDTKVEEVLDILPLIDLFLIMSVVPGLSGQSFIEDTYNKFEIANNYRKSYNLNFKLQADGGVNECNIGKLAKLGVDIAVVGSALYKAEDKAEYIKKLKALCS